MRSLFSWLRLCAFVLLATIAISSLLSAQTIDSDTAVRGIDASVSARDENVLAYTVTEHYSVFRNEDKEHPAAQVLVKTEYRKDQGKTFTILNQSGSSLILKEVMPRILQSERELTQPGNRAQAVITSANYSMRLKAREKVADRDCLLFSIAPRHNSPYLFTGTLWVDASDQSIVQLQGIAAKSPSVFTGATQVSRTYDKINGYPMATHAIATSNSWLLGRTTIQIEYSGYQITLRNGASVSNETSASK